MHFNIEYFIVNKQISNIDKNYFLFIFKWLSLFDDLLIVCLDDDAGVDFSDDNTGLRAFNGGLLIESLSISFRNVSI